MAYSGARGTHSWKNLKSKSRVRLSLKNTDPMNRIRKNGSATLGTDTLKIFHESLSCFACINIILLLLWTTRTVSSHTLCSKHFLLLHCRSQDNRDKNARSSRNWSHPSRVEQLGGFHYFDNTPYTYIGTKTQKPLVRSMDPRIRIRIQIHPKMSWIRNTAF